MIKLIPCPKITKRELMTALMEGRRFVSKPHDYPVNCDLEYVIHWDDNFGDSPIRLGTGRWLWRGFKYLHEITESHWYDNIPEEGVLCWVTTSDTSHEKPACLIFSYTGRLFVDAGDYGWDTATPVKPADLYQEPV